MSVKFCIAIIPKYFPLRLRIACRLAQSIRIILTFSRAWYLNSWLHFSYCYPQGQSTAQTCCPGPAELRPAGGEQW